MTSRTVLTTIILILPALAGGSKLNPSDDWEGRASVQEEVAEALARQAAALQQQREEAAREMAERAQTRETWEAAATDTRGSPEADRQPVVSRYVKRVLVRSSGEKEELKVPVLVWPRGARPPLEMWVSQEEFDGFTMAYTNLRGPGFQVRAEVLPQFAADDIGREASLRLRHVLRPEATLTFYTFDASEFIPELGTEFLLGYAEGIKETTRDDIVRVDERALLADVQVGFGGTEVHCLPYTVKIEEQPADGETVEHEVERRDYLVMIRRTLLVIRLECPVDLSPAITSEWEAFVRRANVLQPPVVAAQ